jgi:cytochrome P450
MATQAQMESEVPVLDIDAYGPDSLLNPAPFYNALRDTAAVTYLEPNNAYAIGRFAEAEIVTKDWQTYSSARGMGLMDITEPGLIRPVTQMLEEDPPRHPALRKVMQRLMSPSTIKSFRGMFSKRAEFLVDELLQKGKIDGSVDIAQTFILDVFPRVIGVELPPKPAVAVSTMMLNLMGPVNEVAQQAIEAAEPHLEWFAGATQRNNCAAGGLAECTYKAQEDGLLPESFAESMAVTFVAGGFDSTLAGIANTVLLLAKNPEQWAKVSADPSLVGAAFEESVRMEPPFRAYYRMTTKDTELSGYKS